MMMVMLIIVALHSPKQRSFRQKVIFSKLLSHITMLMVTDHGICIKPMISLQYLYCPQSWKSCPQFRKSEEARQKWSILTPKKVNMRAKKKDFPRIHIDMAFLQKTGSKLVNFGLHGLLYILQTPIGGRHPVPCLTTQITERRGTAMYYPFPLLTILK